MKISRISLVILAVAFALSVPLHAVDKLTVLHSLNPNNGDGSGPTGGLFMDNAGNLYGGGTSGNIFKLTPDGSGGWTYSVLSTCCSYALGSFVMDQAGSLYGTTFFGEVFQLSPSGSGSWTETTIFSGQLVSPLIIDSAGNLYGQTAGGGSNNLGFIMELSPVSGGGWLMTDLHDFSGPDGAGGAGAAGIVPGLMMDFSGDMYGTTFNGGTNNDGVVFKLHKTSSGWREVVLHNFKGTDGLNPDAPLVMDAAGNLYGTTSDGGANGFGVVFETSRLTGTWQTRVLHAFAGLNVDGAYPNAALLIDSSGNLYGTTAAGGTSNECTVGYANGCGTAFELTPQGAHWKETILHNFLSKGDGGVPGGVISDASGNLYGGALFGGPYQNAGVVFELSPQVP
ncbi:MAG TPA: choice-of-anchor tandem repeat GloVer-containing protein [Candidatus Acidoferrum sp.]|jgi:uncharacterized repeat protein (TIGR03803 family)|nr:choice-of-anchor tandem repeat GloVer-containing protein [Candidatus Acidoferrum sp.]